jgi:hypothetical protein
VIDSATVAAATPDDDTTTVGTLGHLSVHHLQGGKINYHPKLWLAISTKTTLTQKKIKKA